VTTFANPAETQKRKRMARWLSGNGIEIGALHNPLSVPEGAEVRYVDRFDEAHLREHYPELADQLLVPVSLIGNAQDLSALSDDSVDFLIANHLFEHLDNPIRGLEEMVRVLRPGGVLYLALPEPRATFDSRRDLTSVKHLVRDYRRGPKHSRKAHFTEWVERVEWFVEGGQVDDVGARVRYLSEKDYSIHYHVWRPDTFMDFLSAARAVTGIELELVDFAPCDRGKDNEFIFVFLKGIGGAPPAVPPLPGEAANEPAVGAPEPEALPPPPAPTAADPQMAGRPGHDRALGRGRRFKRWFGSTPMGRRLRPFYRAAIRSFRGARRRLTRI
jgi:predicted SAM-dependent methyltransferase